MQIRDLRLPAKIRKFKQSEDGTTMVEFAICVSLFLLILFAVIDFGRLGYSWVVAEKAMQQATRIATVRPAVCADVPTFHLRTNPNDRTQNAGTLCRESPGLCVDTGLIQCTLATPEAGTAGAETADEIWNSIRELLPPGTSKSNIMVGYDYDPRLGFLGGPFVPVVTSELVGSFNAGVKTDLMFEFVTPLSALAATTGAANASTILPDGTNCTGCIPFPAISVTLPGEDLNQGVDG